MIRHSATVLDPHCAIMRPSSLRRARRSAILRSTSARCCLAMTSIASQGRSSSSARSSKARTWSSEKPRSRERRMKLNRLRCSESEARLASCRRRGSRPDSGARRHVAAGHRRGAPPGHGRPSNCQCPGYPDIFREREAVAVIRCAGTLRSCAQRSRESGQAPVVGAMLGANQLRKKAPSRRHAYPASEQVGGACVRAFGLIGKSVAEPPRELGRERRRSWSCIGMQFQSGISPPWLKNEMMAAAVIAG